MYPVTGNIYTNESLEVPCHHWLWSSVFVSHSPPCHYHIYPVTTHMHCSCQPPRAFVVSYSVSRSCGRARIHIASCAVRIILIHNCFFRRRSIYCFFAIRFISFFRPICDYVFALLRPVACEDPVLAVAITKVINSLFSFHYSLSTL